MSIKRRFHETDGDPPAAPPVSSLAARRRIIIDGDRSRHTRFHPKRPSGSCLIDCIGVVDKQGEAGTLPAHRVLQHLQVAIGIAESRNRPATDVFVDLVVWLECRHGVDSRP